MGKENKIKILVVGPVGAGKTSVCNYLGEAVENAVGDLRPTKGVRIVELSADRLLISKKIEVELWDCSGSPDYTHCWPAMRHNVNGIIFVYSKNDDRERAILSKMYHFFVQNSDFFDRNCIVLYNHRGENKLAPINEPPLPELMQVSIDLESEGQKLKQTFNDFLKSLASV